MEKTFVVAGGSSGIGLQLCKILTAKNYRAINFSRNNLSNDVAIENYQIDFSKTDLQLPDLDFPIDGLVYMPGSIQLKPFRAFTSSDFINDFNLNVLGATVLIKKYLPNLQQVNQSSIVLMSSVAVQTGMPFHSLVGASKGALEGLTRNLAAEFSPKIRVNAIAPSLTETPLAEKFLNTDEKRKASAERHPLKSIGNAADVAELINFLLNDTSKFITGQIIQVDGGMSSIRKF
jgi:NAD(P)-dependent dehydrogenase (short-subunit alcohol dehydrogenase family)